MNYDPPPLSRPEDMPPIHTQEDVCQTWRALMGELGFSQRYLWFIFVAADGRLVPHINQVEGMPVVPADGDCAKFIRVVGQVIADLDPTLTVAVLWSRPGSAAATGADIAWAKQLTAEARTQHVRMWPVHLANDVDLRVFTPDELLAA